MTGFKTPFPGAACVLLCALLAAGCGKQDGPPPLPVAATVDKAAISQLAVAIAAPEEDRTRRNAQLESFVAEQLMANAALKDKLEDDPVNAATLENARRQILARAYIRKKSATVARPSADEVSAYYAAHPELFAQRRIYRLQEIGVKGTSERIEELDLRLRGLANFGLRAAELKKMNVPFTTGVGVKPAEDIPSDLLRTLSQLKDGDSFTVPNAGGAAFVQITGVEEQPLNRAQAQAGIERFLMNQRLGQLINLETKRLRSAARIEYVAPFAAPAP